MKDRTNEFESSVNSFSAGKFPVFSANKQAVAFAYSMGTPAGLFMERATALSRAFPAVNSKLESLLKLAKNKAIFDDRPEEFNSLAATIKSELASLNRHIQDLKAEQERLSSSTQVSRTATKTSQEHWKQIVVILQTRTAQAFKAYEQTQDVRAQTLKSKKDRKEQFGSGLADGIGSARQPSPYAQPSPTSITAVSSRQRPLLDPLLKVNVKNVAMTHPGDALAHEQSHTAIDFGDAGEQQALLQTQQQVDPTTLRSRSNALGAIEATINELGTIYSQLAHMVAQQGELVQRIDVNIEDMGLNVQRGQDQLTRYLRRVGSNRWLLVKIFAILIAFIVVFRLLFV